MSGSISSLRRSDSSRASRSLISRGRSCGQGSSRESAARSPRRARGPCAPRDAAARCGRRAARGWWAASRRSATATPAVQRSPSRFSAPSWTSMRTSSPTKSGLPSLVASTRAGDRGRQRFRADHVRGQPRRCASVEPGERHHVADEAAGRRQRRARVAQLGPRGTRAPAAARRCPTARGARSGRAATAPPTGCRRSPAPPAARPPARRAGGGRRRRSPPAKPACRRASAATPLAIRARSGSSPGSADLIAARRASPLVAVVDAKQPAQRFGERREGGATGRIAMREQDARLVAEAAA